MQWEYKTVRFEPSGFLSIRVNLNPAQFDDCLASAGSDGWELVDTLTLSEDGCTSYCILIFKRPIEAQ